MTESEMLALCDELMERAGFVVDKYSQDRRTRSQLAGHPDRHYTGHGFSLFVEGKVGINGLTTAEEAWWKEHLPAFCPPLVDGRVWRSLDDAQEWLQENMA
jgi:hypothetical protein